MDLSILSKVTLITIITDLQTKADTYDKVLDTLQEVRAQKKSLESNLSGHRKALNAEITAKLEHFDTIKNLERKLEAAESLSHSDRYANNALRKEIAELRHQMKNMVPKYTGDTTKCYFSHLIGAPARKIETIKLMRTELGIGLKEAKAFVEGYGTYDIKRDHATHIMDRLEILDTGYTLLQCLDNDIEDLEVNF